MKNFAIVLWVLQLLAAIGMAIAALINIESIVVTGPLLTIVGLLLAAATRCVHSKLVLVYALSGPLMCSLCAILIAVFELSPHQAQWPIASIITAYAVANALLAASVLFSIRKLPSHVYSNQRFVWRYSLKSLLIVMAGVSMVIVAGKLLVHYFSRSEWLFFGGFSLATVALVVTISWRFFKTLNATKNATDATFTDVVPQAIHDGPLGEIR